MIETLIEHIADVLENTGAAIDNISRDIFRGRGAQKVSARAASVNPEKPADLEEALLRLGRCSDLVSRLRESLAGLRRMLSFFTSARKDLPAEMTEHLRTLSHDLHPLGDHASFLSQKVNFLLDATLGLINVEQNAIIKIFTVAAVLSCRRQSSARSTG